MIGVRGVAVLESGRATVVPGDGLLNPVALAAIAVLVINDHVLKAAWPGLVTGKLSDFCGLLFFPLFLQAAWEVATLGRRGVGDLRVGLLSVIVTGTIFAAVKTLPAAADLYSVGLGWAQWFIGALPAAAGGDVVTPHRVSVVMDATDLVALPILLVSYWLMKGRARDRRQSATGTEEDLER